MKSSELVSVIIPSYNREKSLSDTLVSLYQQRGIHQQAEVILIDNGSTDGTAAIGKEYAATHANFTYRYDNTPGLLTGRHLGAAIAKGSTLAFIDDDVELSATWLDTIFQNTIEQKKAVLMTGPTLPKYEVYPPHWLSAFWNHLSNDKKFCGYLSLLDLGSEEQWVAPDFVWGLNYIIDKNLLYELGGFHPDCVPRAYQKYQGDGETGLSIKAKSKNIDALYHPGAMLYHVISKDRLTPEYFDNRAFYQGVCDSFSVLRKQSGLYPTPPVVAAEKKPSPGFFQKLFAGTSAPKQEQTPLVNSVAQQEIDKLKARFASKVQEGYQFHQQHVQSSAAIHDWVMRNDYFNYELPND